MVCFAWNVRYINNVYNKSGRGSVWLERCVRDAEAGGSNPLAPTNLGTKSHDMTLCDIMGFFVLRTKIYTNSRAFPWIAAILPAIIFLRKRG